MGSPSSSTITILLYPFLLLLLCSLCSSVHGANSPFDDSSLTSIPAHLYHSSDSLLKEIDALVSRHSDRLFIEKKRGSNRGYLAEIVAVTYNYTKGQNTKPKFRVLLSFGQHGRELITTELALHLLRVFVGEKIIYNLELKSIENILENLVIKVVPMENLNGRKLVEAGDHCERRNGRGVDLNRNWSVDWGKKEKDYDPYEENPGSAPFSEPEAQIMRIISNSFNPHIWVNVHSGMEALFMPYDHKNTTPAGFPGYLMRSVLEDLNKYQFKNKCVVGSGGGSVGYLAHGTTTDYMYEIAKVPMPFTFEIYGDPTASTKDCFKMFNPMEKTTFNNVIDEWSMAFLTLFDAGPKRLTSDKTVSRFFIRDNDFNQKERIKRDGFELAIQELRNYFRLFLLSTVLLLFMFCSRITRSKYRDLGFNLNLNVS
ncbi:hypothetical protein LUZ60_009427 [Juncus effusus]|nr:hypothetical protein LUZ60_009427 [Juncus effusus]